MTMMTMMSTKMMRLSWIALACALLGSLGCSGEDEPGAGQGSVSVTAYGEAFIEEGIPASALADGWAISFDTFTVSVSDVVVGGKTMPASDPVALTAASNGQGKVIATALVPAGEHTGSSFVISRVVVSGEATKEGVTKRFAWTFDQSTRYGACETTTSVVNAQAATLQITVHADHLFYDSLVSEAPALRFQALADADADGDDQITQAELEAASVGAYDVGSGGDVTNLWAYLVAQSRTLGHVDGEGHCEAHDHDAHDHDAHQR